MSTGWDAHALCFACSHLASRAAFAGKDRISSVSLKKLEVMVPEFLSQYDSSNIEQPTSPELQRSLEIVEWAAYIYQTYAVDDHLKSFACTDDGLVDLAFLSWALRHGPSRR